MLSFALQYIAGALAFPLADYLLFGFWCDSIQTAFMAGAVLMLLYLVVRPLFRLLLGLFNLLTLGLLFIALDTGFIYFLTLLFPGKIQYLNITWAVAAAGIINIVRLLTGMLFRKRK